MEQEKNYFASNLKFLRQKYQMEQLDLASRLGRKSSSSISEWERGKYTPKAGVLNDIAKIFNVSLSDLMSQDLSTDPDTFTTPDGKEIDLSNLREKVVLFDGKPLSDDDVRKISQIIKLSLGVTDLEDR